MEHHAPHSSSVFEGYYSKFDLPSGAKLAIIISKVKNTSNRPHVVSITYVPHDVSNTFQRELEPQRLDMLTFSATTHAFGLEIPGLGHVRWDADSTTTYSLDHADFSFHATTTSRVPWSEHTNTPEALLVHLPLPLHWHVQSLSSECPFTLSIPSYPDLPKEDQSGTMLVHQEKNWAHSFPSAHMWLQARSSDNSTQFCCAGGQILGMEAFLLGYRSPNLNIDFRPPFAVRVLGLSPFLSYKTDWENRSFDLSVQDFYSKVVVRADAPKGTFFPLSAPFAEGHKANLLNESFQATIRVEVWRRGSVFGAWRRVREEVYEGASLEFGGGYYGKAGSEESYN